jgi:hypothetical protein
MAKSKKTKRDLHARKKGQQEAHKRKTHSSRIIEAKKRVFHPGQDTAETMLTQFVDRIMQRTRDAMGKPVQEDSHVQ